MNFCSKGQGTADTILCFLTDFKFVVKPENVFKWSLNSPMIMAIFGAYFIGTSSKHALENQHVQQFIHSEDHHFDLIIVEDIMHDSLLMFGHKFKAPIVSICE